MKFALKIVSLFCKVIVGLTNLPGPSQSVSQMHHKSNIPGVP